MSLSLNFRNSAYAQETGNFPIFLMTIDHPDLADPIRLSSDNTVRLVETPSEIVYGTQSSGNDYYQFPGKLTLPSDTDDGPGMLTFQFSNVNRKYVEIIRSIEGPATFDVDMVMSNAVDVVEKSWPQFKIKKIPWDAGVIAFKATLQTLMNEPSPAGTYTPAHFPGKFRGL